MQNVADIGLDSQEDYDQLESSLAQIDLIIALHDNVTRRGNWGEPGSDIDRLGIAMPPHPVPLKRTLPAAWSATRVSLEHLQRELRAALPPRRSFMPTALRRQHTILPTVLQSVARRALLASARCCYILAPDSHEERIENALDMLDQDARSQRRHYEAMKEFETLSQLRPPPALVEKQEVMRQSLLERKKKRVGDEVMLSESARLIEKLLRESGHEEFPARQIAEHFTWLFHVYSGVAHAWGWPWMAPGTDSAPGHFIADFSTTVSVGHVALQLVDQRSTASPP
ncbi:hypothetical protein O9K63_09105 [Janibacter cremeus]|uniref:hypothetical protein n=1 Tax=Janibacter cremeus TaxID=1285192 RepID=UPI0023F92FFF|nr:hypothetical protein [Janibacter cremeus]WEV76764.1 hypothetical protein O9K63_09105 [Janibacter cremeus]